MIFLYINLKYKKLRSNYFHNTAPNSRLAGKSIMFPYGIHDLRPDTGNNFKIKLS